VGVVGRRCVYLMVRWGWGKGVGAGNEYKI